MSDFVTLISMIACVVGIYFLGRSMVNELRVNEPRHHCQLDEMHKRLKELNKYIVDGSISQEYNDMQFLKKLEYIEALNKNMEKALIASLKYEEKIIKILEDQKPKKDKQ
jgi:hypothetical protein